MGEGVLGEAVVEVHEFLIPFKGKENSEAPERFGIYNLLLITFETMLS